MNSDILKFESRRSLLSEHIGGHPYLGLGWNLLLMATQIELTMLSKRRREILMADQ